MNFDETVAAVLTLLGRRVVVTLSLAGESESENLWLAVGTLAGPAELNRVRQLTRALYSEEEDPLTSHPAYQELVARDLQEHLAREFASDDAIRLGFQEMSLIEGFFLRKSHFAHAEWVVADGVEEGQYLRIALVGGLRMEMLAPGDRAAS
jgi:hypothetical protein